MTKLKAIALASAAALFIPCRAAQPSVLDQQGASAAPDHKYPQVVSATLKNGMKILVLEKHSSPTIFFHTCFKVGAIDNPTGKTGLAHLFEHMIFKGTKNIGTTNYSAEKKLMAEMDEVADRLNAARSAVPLDQARVDALTKQLRDLELKSDQYIIKNEYQKVYSGIGAYGLNAMTSFDYTGYVVALPSNRLESWMVIESERFRNPVLREFYRERDVVMEEMRMDNSKPDRHLRDMTPSFVFSAHPYRNPIIGWEDDIARLTRGDAEEYFRRYYGPNNAVVAIVGDVNPEEVVKLATKYFEDIPVRALPDRYLTTEPRQEGERKATFNIKTSPQFLMVYKKPGITDPDEPVFNVISALFSSGKTGRLYKNIVEKKKIAIAAASGADYPGYRYPNGFVFVGVPKAPHTNAEVEQAIYEEIERLKTEPVTQLELQRVINQWTVGLISDMDSGEDMAETLARSESIMGSWKYYWNLVEDMKKVTPEDIQRVAKRYFVSDSRTVVYLEPVQAK